MRILFKNIKELIQIRESGISFVSGSDMSILPNIKNAFLLVEDGLISDFGTMDACPDTKAEQVIDVTGQMMMPTWCDSHTHIVYAGNRESEFVDKIKGLTYQEIANKGGGILNSAKKLQKLSEADLYEESKVRLEAVIAMGTGAVEIKSGYGLTVESELKMLSVIKQLKKNYDLPIKATFLGAHAVPKAYVNDKEGYMQLIINEMIPLISEANLADYIDVFCETGYFSVEDTQRIMQAGKAHGLESKIHVNQFNSIGGVQIAVAHKALSVDHLEEMTDADIESLKNTKTMPVALPGCSFFLSIPYTPGRKMIDDGLPLALATDYNPGSSPSGNMNFVVSAACIKMKLTPEEAINAATINGAYAMGLENQVGSITRGKLANLIVTKPINSYGFIPYSFGETQIDKVYIKGQQIN
ncbi:imidazolonepropionase [Siansivirga zeaxanthinifaciens]|uniref:Imidazolonepropionase n=1 Tax=Siansivirga zeaxanthinifaciens CC-SAMT-1 TaxID=1454006 RepID=A0A0C5VWL8_9FLAO|nr:imidazolonepropionase [Siansivirga zeaxanthinifaciens]AJR03516.1 imidazolonepropionase [Siansivirga zeaxanthinifaciens CC-SAMT-1]